MRLFLDEHFVAACKFSGAKSPARWLHVWRLNGTWQIAVYRRELRAGANGSGWRVARGCPVDWNNGRESGGSRLDRDRSRSISSDRLVRCREDARPRCQMVYGTNDRAAPIIPMRSAYRRNAHHALFFFGRNEITAEDARPPLEGIRDLVL